MTDEPFPTLTFPYFRMSWNEMVHALLNQHKTIKKLRKEWDEMHPENFAGYVEDLQYENKVNKEKIATLERKVAQLSAKVYKKNGVGTSTNKH